MTANEAMARFSGDRFALESAGVEITAVGEKAAECTVQLRPEHLNSLGRPMGGLIFTLADFCFAVAANSETMGTVSQTANITFLSAAQGKTLTARARCVRDGRTTCLYQVDVADETGALVAYVTVGGYHAALNMEEEPK
jgi:acyl-CoA thioesterase